MVVGLLHPGAMGSAVGAALAERGHRVLWASEGRTAATAERAREARLEDTGELSVLFASSEIVLSICPPDSALEVAALAADFQGIFVDANAIAPQTAVEVAETVGGSYVDGGIIGPPPKRAGTTRMYLWGKRAGEVASAFAGTRVDAPVLAVTGPMAASALKMTYGAWTKGSAALLLAIARTAAALGVEGSLRQEWALSQPQLSDRLAAAQRDAAEKGRRWTGEMRQIATTTRARISPRASIWPPLRSTTTLELGRSRDSQAAGRRVCHLMLASSLVQ